MQNEKLLLKVKDEKLRKKKIADQHKQYFNNFDTMLAKAVNGKDWLRNEQVAKIITEAIHVRDKKIYDLLVYCIMPNHVHIVFAVARSGTSLYKILQSLKAYTARKANKLLNHKGAFWQHESYDHVVRNGKELERIVSYVLNNPV